MKSSVVLISSSDDDDGNLDDDEEEEELESQDEEYDVDDCDDDDDEEEELESQDEEYDLDNCDDDDDDDDDESDEEECFDDRNERRDRFHQGRNDLQDLSLNECKEYLRKHGLRLSGTKEECVQRIKEHGRLKDGRGESLYPRSSFSINCTGDACKGDVVLFRQKVHKKQGNIAGKRTVAGRIIKESYGASKQQHTFTVEVLWSKPFKNLPPLSTLLVKGRKLYKFGTFRQPWTCEAERSKVLGEKHSRGDAARQKRTLRKTDIVSNNNKGRKRQKSSHGGPSQSKPKTLIDKHKSVKRRGAAASAPAKKNTTAHKKQAQFQKTDLKRSIQPNFHSYPNRSIYPDRHFQESSSSSSYFPYDKTSLPNFPPFGFLDTGGYNNGHARPNRVLYQPPRYYTYNHDEPVPRYRLG